MALQNIHKGEVVIKVFDNRGVQVLNNKINVYDDNIKLDLTSLEQGIYFIQLITDDMIKYNKLMIK